MAASLTVPLPLPQLNDVLRAVKSHWSYYAREKQLHTRRVALLARLARLRPVAGPVRLVLVWHPRDRRVDLSNLSHAVKYIEDGLVAAGVLPDDSQRWVRAISHELAGIDKQHPHVVVSWEDA